MERVYGWKRDLVDHRDRKYGIAPVTEVPLPKKVSLRDKMPPIHAQGSLSCCTAEAVTAVLHYRELTDENPRLVKPSVLFQFYNSLLLDGTIQEADGVSIRTAVKAAARYGFCEDKLWPFDPAKVKTKPSKRSYEQAKQWKLTDYTRIDETGFQFEYLLKHHLTLNNPIVFGAAIYESFESEQVARTGFVSMPRNDERCLGGHAQVIVGYSDETETFEVRNSWGDQWGQGGHSQMPFRYVTDHDLAADFWVIGTVQ